MGAINLEAVKERFSGASVEIAILDQEGGDQAPAVRKSIQKVQLCPDGTHIRLYFDHMYFLAVPLSSQVSESDRLWSAYDADSGLTYTVKKV
ncbi:hypothetical protein [Bacillus sp. FJAT-29814]|uniref:hypothetical protein n=1 Tax=Bacillus sp. FJAT-29814 TaxID=1729688 RepID=UPI000B0160E3|nr:hypothetical protein [Bacillus sp. FJAT-29814]